MTTLTNSGDFTGSRIRISNSGGTSKRMGNLIKPLKKLTANHLPVILKSISKPASKVFEFFTIISGLWNIVQNGRRLPEWRNKHFEEGFRKDLQI
jgi:hypothetical protein